jgi:uncharacterized protein (DUF1697 family)
MRWIVLFRGINVGGKHVLPMKELGSLLESLGCRNVRTYIQSGNAVLESPERDPSKLGRRIAKAIAAQRGFEPRILLVDLPELERVIASNPFVEAEAEPKSLHVGFLESEPNAPDLEALARLRTGRERFQLVDRALYLHTPDGFGPSKLAAQAEKLLGVPMTARNWRTVQKIREIAAK